jgi:hypothetical protein
MFGAGAHSTAGGRQLVYPNSPCVIWRLDQCDAEGLLFVCERSRESCGPYVYIGLRSLSAIQPLTMR